MYWHVNVYPGYIYIIYILISDGIQVTPQTVQNTGLVCHKVCRFCCNQKEGVKPRATSNERRLNRCVRRRGEESESHHS